MGDVMVSKKAKAYRVQDRGRLTGTSGKKTPVLDVLPDTGNARADNADPWHARFWNRRAAKKYCAWRNAGGRIR